MCWCKRNPSGPQSGFTSGCSSKNELCENSKALLALKLTYLCRVNLVLDSGPLCFPEMQDYVLIMGASS